MKISRFQFYMIAAHLNPTDSEEWAKLAVMSLDFGKIDEAIICYTKGLYSLKTLAHKIHVVIC